MTTTTLDKLGRGRYLGQIKKVGNRKYSWLPCPDCKKSKWVPVPLDMKKANRATLCRKCIGLRRRTIHMKPGDRFGGYLTFVREVSKSELPNITAKQHSSSVGRLAEFVCDCGEHIVVRVDFVASRNNRSCGCKSRNGNYQARKAAAGADYPYIVLWNVFRRNAKARGIDFQINVADVKRLYKKQQGKCVYTGHWLRMPDSYTQVHDPDIASIDRTDSKTGYIKSNIQLVVKGVNLMKGTMTPGNFVAMCTEIANYSRS